MPSKKDSENTNPRLFNFLYRDQDTLNSYYAQAFDGVIKSVQQAKSTGTTKQNKTTPLAIASPLLKFTHERLNSTSESDTQMIDPHDIITLDVLQWLEESGFIKHDVNQLTKASIVKFVGDAFFIDHKLLTISLTEGMKMLQNYNSTVPLPEGAELLVGSAMNIMSQMLTGPSVIITNDGIVLLGELKVEYLSAPVTNRYIVTGGRFIESVTIIGLITENVAYNPPTGSVLAGVTGLADGLSQMFATVATHFIQPIVIYQEITP